MRTKDESAVVRGAEGKRAYWVARVSEWGGSKQTQKAFCAQRGLALSTFQWWRAKLARGSNSATVSFLPVSVDTSAGGRECAIEVELRSRTRLRLEGEAALRALDRLVARIR
jgi:hypothetical protein